MTRRKAEGPASAARSGEAKRPIVTLLTDFGARDGFVGIVKGVILGECRDVELVDLTHDVGPQDVFGGALVLAAAVDHFPAGTIHLAVVDPGVGTERRQLLIETDEFVLIGPDNGLLSLAAEKRTVRSVVQLDAGDDSRASASRTFQARDVFASVAGRMAAGRSPADVGSKVEGFERLTAPEPRRRDDGVEGKIIHVDRFGNLVSNVRREDLGHFLESGVSITIGGVQIAEVSPHYSTVREGKPVAVWNSWERLEIAIRNGSAARQLRGRIGDRLQVKPRR